MVTCSSATSSLLPLLFSLLLLLCCCTEISLSTATITSSSKPAAIPSTVTPKAAALQYWNLKVGGDKPPPAILLKKLSMLSPQEIVTQSFHNMLAMMAVDEAGESAMVTILPHIFHGHRHEDSHNHATTSGGAGTDFSNTDNDNTRIISEANMIFFHGVDEINREMTAERLPDTRKATGDMKNNATFFYGEVDELNKDMMAKKLNNVTFFYRDVDEFKKEMEAEKLPGMKKTTEDMNNNVTFFYGDVDEPNKDVTAEKLPGDMNNNVTFFYGDVDELSEDMTAEKLPGDMNNNVTFFYGDVDELSEDMTAEKLPDDMNNNVTFFYGVDEFNKEMATEKLPSAKKAAEDTKSNEANVTFFYGVDELNIDTTADLSNINKRKKEGDEKRKRATISATAVNPIRSPAICFKERQLRRGMLMPMLDFKRILSTQHFLPRSIVNAVPFTADATKSIFHMHQVEGTKISNMVDTAMKVCNMPPNHAETRGCIRSAEDMIDYAISALGTNNVEARSTENDHGSGANILIGDVKAVHHGNNFIEAVTCHHLDFPYLLYLCHTVPKTRVYEVEILDAETKETINHATAICHMDTSTWAPSHLFLKALRSMPGDTEVCHWINPWEMVWTAATLSTRAII